MTDAERQQWSRDCADVIASKCDPVDALLLAEQVYLEVALRQGKPVARCQCGDLFQAKRADHVWCKPVCQVRHIRAARRAA